MNNIWIISDTHFNHNKDFILQPRCFSTVEEMNEGIIERWNSLVQSNDIVYHLGDMALGDINDAIPLIKRLNGKIKLAIGNHDTDAKLKIYSTLSNIEDIQFGYRIKKGKNTFLLTHYPQLTGNYDTSKTYSIHGHTHCSNTFTKGYDLMFNVSCEALICTPINIESISPLIKVNLLDKNN